MKKFFPKYSSNERQDRFLKDLLNHIKTDCISLIHGII